MNMLRGLGRIGALSGVSIWLVGAEACVTIRAPSFMTPAPRREWPARLELAQHRAAEGRFDAADSVLAIFAHVFHAQSKSVHRQHCLATFLGRGVLQNQSPGGHAAQVPGSRTPRNVTVPAPAFGQFEREVDLLPTAKRLGVERR